MAGRTMKDFVAVGRKIIAVGRNYSEHAKELGNAVPTEPVVFLKPTSSYIKEGQPIKMPPGAAELHHEVELGLVIGEAGSCISEQEAMKHVAGYTLALDMTDRKKQHELKKAKLPWTLAKGFDTSCPVSDFIPSSQIAEPQSVQLWLKVNGEKRQDGNTRDMIFSLPFLISWCSRYFRLEPGDVILTGTPKGVGPVRPGDQIECGIGDQFRMVFNVEN